MCGSDFEPDVEELDGSLYEVVDPVSGAVIGTPSDFLATNAMANEGKEWANDMAQDGVFYLGLQGDREVIVRLKK